MHRRHIVTALAVIAAATVAVAPAEAKPKHHKPKPFKKTVTFTDQTPDPTGGAIMADADPTKNICDGTLPRETGITVKIPAPGKLKVELSDFEGDWGLSIRDSEGAFVDGDDVNPDPSSPVYESVTHKFKKKGTFILLPCNLGGTTTATMTYKYTPS